VHLLFLDESGQLSERRFFALGGVALRDADWHALRDLWQETLAAHRWPADREVKWHGIRTGEVPPELADAVVDALGRSATRLRRAEPNKFGTGHSNARMPLQKRSIVISKLKNAVCAPEYGSDASSAYTRRSPPGERRPGRHLRTIQLQDMPRPIAGSAALAAPPAAATRAAAASPGQPNRHSRTRPATAPPHVAP
jgi:hypothetical protein